MTVSETNYTCLVAVDCQFTPVEPSQITNNEQSIEGGGGMPPGGGEGEGGGGMPPARRFLSRYLSTVTPTMTSFSL